MVSKLLQIQGTILKTNNLHTVIWFIGQMSRVFANRPGDRGFNPRSSHTKEV